MVALPKAPRRPLREAEKTDIQWLVPQLCKLRGYGTGEAVCRHIYRNEAAELTKFGRQRPRNEVVTGQEHEMAG